MEPKLTIGRELEGHYAGCFTLFVQDDVPFNLIMDAITAHETIIHVYFGAGRRTYVNPTTVNALHKARPEMLISIEYNGVQSESFLDMANSLAKGVAGYVIWIFPLVAFDNKMLNEIPTGRHYKEKRIAAEEAIEEGVSYVMRSKSLSGFAKVETANKVFVFPLNAEGATVCSWGAYDSDVEL